MEKYTKINEYEIEVIKEAPIVEPIVVTYQRDFIENQIISITKQRDEMIAIKETELKECQDILKEMDRLEIIAKPEETTSIELNSNPVGR